MVEENYDQGDHPKPKRHTAKLCALAIRQRIVNALADSDSKRAIARALRVSNNTVTAIAEQESRKARIAAQAERIAALVAAVERIEKRAKAGVVEVSALPAQRDA